ncbi:helix-turn-helix domain-containing protein [Candidatus Collierbacteria bacterium]|nr:helix-turn-helix domain-containing protein [Candidatus Collierbacteria bacterium]
MLNTINTSRVYTPEQVATLLQLSKNTIYELINKGEIVAKKLGKVYRIPATSLSFMFTGLDFDLYNADSEDRQYLNKIQQEIAKIRSEA